MDGIHIYTREEWTIVEGAIPRREALEDAATPAIIYRGIDEGVAGRERKIPRGIGAWGQGREYVGDNNDSGWIFYNKVEGAGVGTTTDVGELQGDGGVGIRE
mgnify:CR=1 FL=1